MKINLCFHPRDIQRIEVEKYLPRVVEVMKQHSISFADLFGSILNEELKAQDLDIGIYIKNPQRNIFDYYNDVYFKLCDIF